MKRHFINQGTETPLYSVLAALSLLAACGLVLPVQAANSKTTAAAAKLNASGTKQAATKQSAATRMLAATTAATATANKAQGADVKTPAEPKMETISVRGVVLGPDDKPVPNARVLLYPVSLGEAAHREIATGADGKFQAEIEILALPADGKPVSPKAADVKAVAARPRDVGYVIILAPGLAMTGSAINMEENTFRLTPGIVATGSVKDADGKPVPGAAVRLLGVFSSDHASGKGNVWVRESSKAVFGSKAGADGQWKLENLPREGTALFLLDDERFARVQIQAELSNEAVTTQPLEARPAAKVTGRVMYEGGKPASGVTVTAQGQGTSSSHGSAKTAADGTYVITGLSAGAFRMTVSESSGEWVASAISNLALQSGSTTAIADLVLGRGLLLEGKVIDAESKAPLHGVVIYAHGTHGESQSRPSDKEGRYQLRVVPGSMYFYVSNTPEGYLRPEMNSNVTIAAGQKTIAPIALKKGLTLTGTAFTADGQPATGAVIQSGRHWEGVKAVVDEKGNWTMPGVRPGSKERGEPDGAVNLSSEGEWHLLSPEQVKLPTDTPVKVTMRRIKLADLQGRVVTATGQPVPGATLNLKIFLDKERNSRRSEKRTADAQGRFTLSKLRPEQSVVVSASKEGYRFASGGVVTQQNDVWSVTDVVMLPLQSSLAGRVLDASGKPVAGARVMSPDADGEIGAASRVTTSDAQGRFTLRGLPDGPVLVVAVQKYDAAVAEGKPGTEMTMTLRDVTPPPAADVERAVAMIEEWKKDDNEAQREAARQAAVDLSPRDPERALLLVTKSDGTVTDGARYMIVSALARRDPKRAMEWAPAQLELITDKRMQVYAASDLGLAIAQTNPELATELLRRSKASIKPNDFSEEAATLYVRLAALAGKLKLPEAESLTDMALIAAERSADKQRYHETLGSFAGIVAPGGVNLVERVLADVPPSGQMAALQRAVTSLAPTDAALARKLLGRMEELMNAPRGGVVEAPPADGMYRPQPAQMYASAAFAVVRALAVSDATAALALARAVKDSNSERPVALALAAQGLDAAAAAPVFREAMAAAQGEYWAAATMARVAAMAAQKDAKLGEELFREARERVTRPSPHGDDEMQESFAAYAFYRAPIDPAESRLLLEAEWARYGTPPNRDKPAKDNYDDYMRRQRMTQLAWRWRPSTWIEPWKC
jgi:protocatechuate 3,4-dioxygenase beta subunit